jgi:hypothetical protein
MHNLIDQTDFTTVMHKPTFDMIKEISALFSKVVVLGNNHDMYNVSFQGRELSSKLSNPGVKNHSFEEQHLDFIEYFFKDNQTLWTEMGLTNIWDHREFLALNMRPKIRPKIKPLIDQSIQHHYIDTFDFYNIFDLNIDCLFDYLNVKLDQTKKSHWQIVYQKWRKLHVNRMQFAWYFDNIIDSIINGHALDLTRFNLDIVQEACIQHSLIYHHNLNLKTWQLNKFINTTQLHQLLEPNQHPLSSC